MRTNGHPLMSRGMIGMYRFHRYVGPESYRLEHHGEVLSCVITAIHHQIKQSILERRNGIK